MLPKTIGRESTSTAPNVTITTMAAILGLDFDAVLRTVVRGREIWRSDPAATA